MPITWGKRWKFLGWAQRFLGTQGPAASLAGYLLCWDPLYLWEIVILGLYVCCVEISLTGTSVSPSPLFFVLQFLVGKEIWVHWGQRHFWLYCLLWLCLFCRCPLATLIVFEMRRGPWGQRGFPDWAASCGEIPMLLLPDCLDISLLGRGVSGPASLLTYRAPDSCSGGAGLAWCWRDSLLIRRNELIWGWWNTGCTSPSSVGKTPFYFIIPVVGSQISLLPSYHLPQFFSEFSQVSYVIFRDYSCSKWGEVGRNGSIPSCLEVWQSLLKSFSYFFWHLFY